jgi:CheY-like chemotaxis protein
MIANFALCRRPSPRDRPTDESERKGSVSQGLVLIADDDPEFISELTKILIDRGYLVLGAKDGQAAADLMNKHQLPFSLAIIDVFMPMIGGFELIRRLAEDKSNLKIIAVSNGRQKVLDAAISLGADAGVKKPQPGTPLDAGQWLNEVFLQIGVP